MTTDEPCLIVASNRGPVTYARRDDGTVVERRGVGGLVTAVGGAVRERDVTWIAAAITPEDRARAAPPGGSVVDLGGSGSVRVRMADIEAAAYDEYYNEFSNRILWFLHHYLWEPTHVPDFGADHARAWDSYREVNATFAALVAEEATEPAAALTQDYHLSLLPALLRKEQPELPIAHYWHIPFCQPDEFRLLPDQWATALLEGMLAADLIGFQAERWARNFVACCRDILGARSRGRTLLHGDNLTRIGVYPVAPSEQQLQEESAHPDVATAARRIEEIAGDRLVVLRVDRTELSKNILRGLQAYEVVLEGRPDVHERVVHIVLLAASRRGVPEYEEYLASCVVKAEQINERFARPGWTPLVLEIGDDYHRTLAAYARYDVLVVNSVYDGMNLVAREGPLLNRRDGVLVLSRNAGAVSELGPAALVVNPFDVHETARAIEAALEMPAQQRSALAERLRPLARGTPPDRWLEAQVRDLLRSRSA